MCVYQTGTLFMLKGDFVYAKRALCMISGESCIPTGVCPVRSSR